MRIREVTRTEQTIDVEGVKVQDIIWDDLSGCWSKVTAVDKTSTGVFLTFDDELVEYFKSDEQVRITVPPIEYHI